jgi:micrococcal nuclease|tara:strand:- start:386 stop:766 length:381 start_codon:yes stop_codon:yes gene_type:complete
LDSQRDGKESEIINMYEYKATIRRVVDGDTVDVTLDLGFDILYNNRIRLLGIDTSEIRTRDLEEKALGLAAKDRVKELCPVGSTVILKTTKDDRGKFGRILGEIFVEGQSLNKMLVDEGLAERYYV